MKKFTLTMLASLLCMMPMMAQISTGEPHSSVIPRTGNRPQAGDFGFYIGGTVTQVMDLVESIKNDKQNIWGLPVVNFKYYFTDNWEGRLGFQFACKASNDKQVSDTGTDDDAIAKVSTNHNYTRFLPGAAYHFNTNNILDVYAGAYLPIGWEVDRTTSKSSLGSNDASITQRTGKFIIGAGVLFGLQCFIADLPIAIGIETGFSGMIKAGGSPKTTVKATDAETVTYYDGNPSLKKHAKSEATWGADAAITFSYYFHK